MGEREIEIEVQRERLGGKRRKTESAREASVNMDTRQSTPTNFMRAVERRNYPVGSVGRSPQSTTM